MTPTLCCEFSIDINSLHCRKGFPKPGRISVLKEEFTWNELAHQPAGDRHDSHDRHAQKDAWEIKLNTLSVYCKAEQGMN